MSSCEQPFSWPCSGKVVVLKSRNQSLDVLRGIAVLMVLCYHYPVVPWMTAGWIGVDLFFVLSGFLISGLLFTDLVERGDIDLARFYIRRGLKIYPSFYLFLAATAAFAPSRLWPQLTFVQNYLPAPRDTIWSHTWSLAVEEHFYLVLPLLLIVLHRTKLLRSIPAISIVLFVACIGMRMLPHPDHYASVLFPTHLRMDSLFAGVTLGYFYHFRKWELLTASRWWLAPIAWILLAPSLLSARGNPPLFIVSLNVVGFSILLVWAVTRNWLQCRPIAMIGKYCYGIYLWQLPVRALLPLPHPANWRWFVLYISTCVLIGIALSALIEIPVLRLRDEFLPSLNQKRERSTANWHGNEEQVICDARKSAALSLGIGDSLVSR